MKIPENSDESNPPDSLQETNYTCGHCGDDHFESFTELAEHTASCDAGDDPDETEG